MGKRTSRFGGVATAIGGGVGALLFVFSWAYGGYLSFTSHHDYDPLNAVFPPYAWYVIVDHHWFSTPTEKAMDEIPTDIEPLKRLYFKRLDQWVRDGGKPGEVQRTVVRTCGKLVMLTASSRKRLSFTGKNRKEFDFRVDVCVKMTVNRIHPQPEFKKPEIVNMICRETKVRLFKEMCVRFGLN